MRQTSDLFIHLHGVRKGFFFSYDTTAVLILSQALSRAVVLFPGVMFSIIRAVIFP